jgi:hypothetical protein
VETWRPLYAVEVVLEDLAVEVEEGALAAEFLQPGVGEVIDGMELVEGLDENRATGAGRVEDAEALEFLLPGFPEADEGLALESLRAARSWALGSARALWAVPAASDSCWRRRVSKRVFNTPPRACSTR